MTNWRLVRGIIGTIIAFSCYVPLILWFIFDKNWMLLLTSGLLFVGCMLMLT